MADPKADQAEQEKKVAKILYIGGDITFFKNLEKKYREMVSSVDCVFEQVNATADQNFQSFVIKVIEDQPKIVLIDFSKKELETLHLARVLARQNYPAPIPLLGLCEYKQSSSLVRKAIMTSMPCVHVKSSEFESIVFDINVLSFPEKVQDHGFAMAQMNDLVKAYHPAKVNMVNQNFIKIESNYQMGPKQNLRLNNFWFNKSLFKSNLGMCADQTQENIYYNYKYTQVLQMAHADPVEQTDEMTKEDFDQAQVKRQEVIEDSKRLMKKWLRDSAGDSKPKFLKAYVVDKQGLFFENRQQTDKYPFVFRCQPFMANCKKELTNIKPQLIIFNMEDVDEDERMADPDLAHTFNEGRMFGHLIKTVQEVMQNSLPIIIVFNTGQFDSAHMQKTFNYRNIMAVQSVLNVDLALQMAEMLKKKIEPSIPKPSEGDVYIDKATEQSYAEIETDIVVLGCSEQDIFFNCDEEIPLGTVLRTTFPIDMFLTVVKPPEGTSIQSSYYGILHGVGEEERQELRRHINEVFFRDLEAQKAADREEVAKLKEDYIKRKEEEAEEARRAEEEAKKAEEEEKRAEEEAKKAEEQAKQEEENAKQAEADAERAADSAKNSNEGNS